MADPAEEIVTDPAPVEDAPVEQVQPPQREAVVPVTQPVQPPPYQPPQYVSPERITRARERAAKLDETLGAGGVLREVIEDIAGVADDTVRENLQLRERVQSHDDGLSGLGFWSEYDADPNNKDYPSAQAKIDYLQDLAKSRSNLAYQQASPVDRERMAQIEARGRFFGRVEARRANSNTEATPAPVQTRQVGSTRVVPRGARQAPPVPQKRLTISEYLALGQLPPGYTEQRVNEEL